MAALCKQDELNQQTINHHITAVKMLSRWLWKDNRARQHVLAHLATSNPEGDRRRKRRALTPTEAASLVEATEAGPIVLGMTGPTAPCSTLWRSGPAAIRGTANPDPRTVRLRFRPPDRHGFGRLRQEPPGSRPTALSRPGRSSSSLGGPETPRKARLQGDDQTDGRMLAIDLKAVGIDPETDSGRWTYQRSEEPTSRTW